MQPVNDRAHARGGGDQIWCGQAPRIMGLVAFRRRDVRKLDPANRTQRAAQKNPPAARAKNAAHEVRAAITFLDGPVLRPLPDDSRDDHDGQKCREVFDQINPQRDTAEHEADDGDKDIDRAEKSAQEIQRRDEVVHLLPCGHAAEKFRVFLEQQFDGAARPFHLLLAVRRERRGHEAAREDFRDVHRAPAARIEAHGRVHVFREARRVAADGIECGATEDAVCPDGLRGAVRVHADHHRAVKKIRLLRRTVRHEAVFLIPVRLHGLDEADRRILEIPEHAIEQERRRFVIGIEHDGDLAGGLREGIVDVARLGVRLFHTRHVADAERFACLAQDGIISLIAEVIRVRMADGFHREQCAQNHSARFAGAGRGEYIHGPCPLRCGEWLHLGPRVVDPFHDPPERAVRHRREQRPEKPRVPALFQIQQPDEKDHERHRCDPDERTDLPDGFARRRLRPDRFRRPFQWRPVAKFFIVPDWGRNGRRVTAEGTRCAGKYNAGVGLIEPHRHQSSPTSVPKPSPG